MNVIFRRANLDEINPVLDCNSAQSFAQSISIGGLISLRDSLVPNIR